MRDEEPVVRFMKIMYVKNRRMRTERYLQKDLWKIPSERPMSIYYRGAYEGLCRCFCGTKSKDYARQKEMNSRRKTP